MTTDAPADTLTPARQAVVTFALSTLGWTKPDPRLGKLVAPGDTAAQEVAIEAESLCMLVVLGIQEGVFDLPARGPYVNGSAPRLLEARVHGVPGRATGAMVVPSDAPGGVPMPGDVVWYGPSKLEPFEHVETVTNYLRDGDRLTLMCIAGGERTVAGLETIKAVTRNLVWNGKQWVDIASGRPIIGVIDCDAMATEYGLLAA